MVQNHQAMQETQKTQFDPWVRKSPWRRKWQPTPIFLPEKNPMDRGAWRAAVRGITKRVTFTPLSEMSMDFWNITLQKKKIYASQNSVTVWLSWVRDQLESYSQPSFLSSYPGVPTKTLSLTQEDKKKKRSQNEKCVEWLTGLLFETDEKPSVYLCKSLENHHVGWKPPWMDQSSGFENTPNSTISQTHFPSISTRAWTEKPGGLQFMGSQRVRHELATGQ